MSQEERLVGLFSKTVEGKIRMKRLGYILTEETVTMELCKKAITDASKDKKRRKEVSSILNNIDFYAGKLMRIILDNDYRPSPYKECRVIDRPSGKERLLEKPKFYPDQCVHHVAILLIQNRLIKRYDKYCVSGIKGRGTHYAYRAIRKWIKKDPKNTKYCLQGDIRKCYENIKPDVVIAAFKLFVKDKRYLNLIEIIANSFSSLPLGNYTSMWFGNLVLFIIDKICRNNNGCVYFCRYADDFIVLGPNKRKLHRIRKDIKDVLSYIGLKLKDNWQVYNVDDRGIDFIGFRIFRNYVLMRKRNSLSLSRQVRKYNKKRTPKLARSLLSIIGQLKYFDSYRFKKKYIFPIDRKKMKEVAKR